MTSLDGDTTRQPLCDTEEHTAHLSSFQKSSEEVSELDVGQNLRLCDWRGWTEVKTQCRLAAPMSYVNLVQYSLQVISVMFVGHLGVLELSSASIATSFAGVTGTIVMQGMGSALETLCGQAFGAKQYHLLWLYMQRAEVVLNATCLPLAIIWWYMGSILLALGQDPDISSKAGEYAHWLIPTLFASASLQPLVKYLQTQSIAIPMTLISSFTVVFHTLTCWLLVYKSGLGYCGAALATSISNWINVVLLLVYIRFSRACEKTRAPFSWEAFHDLQGFLKLAIPSGLMMCLEFWSSEILILISGLLPNAELETSNLSICFSILVLVFMIPFGLSAAASTRVSNELGAGCPQAARAAVNVSMGLTILETSTVSLSLFLARNLLGRAYSNEPEVIHYVSSMMPLVACTTILDSIQGVLSGVARGCGRQKVGAYINLGAFYIVGFPVAIVLAFPLHMGGKGLWIGLLCGVSVQTVLLMALTIATDWNRQANEAAVRVSSSIT